MLPYNYYLARLSLSACFFLGFKHFGFLVFFIFGAILSKSNFFFPSLALVVEEMHLVFSLLCGVFILFFVSFKDLFCLNFFLSNNKLIGYFKLNFPARILENEFIRFPTILLILPLGEL